MTIEEAVKTLHWLKLQTGRIENEALDMAIYALRAQQEQENNAPLTLDEMRKMDGEPVWVVCTWPEIYDDPPTGWRILEKSIMGRFGVWKNDSGLVETEYTKTWLAYRRKPEEEAK